MLSQQYHYRKNAQSLKGGYHHEHDEHRALATSLSWKMDVCHEVSNGSYKTKRVLFFVSWFRTIMMGDKRGRCGDMCDIFCGPSCQKILVSSDDSTCTCGASTCDANALCDASQCTCDEGYGGNGTLCQKCIGPDNVTMVTDLCNEIMVNGIPGEIERTDFKELIRSDLWNISLQGLKGVPVKYFDPSNYSFDVIADNILDFIYDNKTFTPPQFIGLQEMLNLLMFRDVSLWPIPMKGKLYHYRTAIFLICLQSARIEYMKWLLT